MIGVALLAGIDMGDHIAVFVAAKLVSLRRTSAAALRVARACWLVCVAPSDIIWLFGL
jgi:hypothetical protein